MKWKKKEPTTKPKHSITSTSSMSFLTDENLTFHRFSDGTISFDSVRKKSDVTSYVDDIIPDMQKKPRLILREVSNASSFARINEETPSTAATTPYGVWTTRESLNSYTNGAALNLSDESTSTIGRNVIPHSSTMLGNGSTMKLINTTSMEMYDDQSSKQTKCSIFRGVILCLCLNLTYANIVRFPRELHRDGLTFLIPYLTLLFFVGLPVVLLEIALGQFLGQGSAHTWRASPFFKGAAMTGRFASWLGTIFTSMQSVLALLYIGWLAMRDVPFRECADVELRNNGYRAIGISGQRCLQQTFLVPVWKNSLYFGLTALGLILLWVLTMISTHSAKVNRRMIYILGFCTMLLLVFETGWDVTRSINEKSFPRMWDFDYTQLAESTIWFNALVQVIFSLNIGIGALPVITGKFLYKGDAVKTTFVYICFNLLISAIAAVFYMMQFNNSKQDTTIYFFPELTTLTTIYDRALDENDPLLARLIPGLAYVMIAFASLISLVIMTYTSSRMIHRHPNYTMCLAALILSIIAFLCPDHLFPSILDSRIIGSIIVCAMIFDIISIVWIYGVKNLYTDLEFSIGRPIFKAWLGFWSLIPLVLIGILVWWAITYVSNELVIDYIPRWFPIVVSLTFVVILACVEVSKQVDYNVCSMIMEATRPSKDWGPADPLVRHSWKQWKSVCEDTGQRDFTLRRRGTKDYTNSIKKGQYSTNHVGSNYGTAQRKPTPAISDTRGSNSPQCGGSVFGDSAIEEDMHSDKFNYKLNGHFGGGSSIGPSPMGSRTSSANGPTKRLYLDPKEVRRSYSMEKQSPTYTSRIEITPAEPTYNRNGIRNPMARSESFQARVIGQPIPPPHHLEYTSSYGPNFQRSIYISGDAASSVDSGAHSTQQPTRLSWRKATLKDDDNEFSTEL